MKKILVIALAVFMLAGTTAMAFETDLKGFFTYRWRYQDNPTGLQSGSTDSYMRHDQDMRVEGKIKANDTSWANIRLAIHDEEWGATNDGYSLTNRDADITVERAWLTHKFPFGLTLDAGLMSGGTWGTSFFDDAGNKYRVKLTQDIPVGKVIFVYEKNTEAGAQNDGANDSEDNDSDDWVLGVVVAAGPVKIMPLVQYTDPGDASGIDNVITAFLAADGKFGVVGFEAEVAYQNTAPAVGSDITTWAAGVNVYANVGPAKVGGWFAYLPTEDGASLALGPDFGNLNILVGDHIDFQAGGNVADAMGFGLYADIAVGDDLTISPMFGYYDGDVSDVSAWEFDLTVAYKVTDSLTYKVFGAYADWDTSPVDADGAFLFGHSLKLSF